MTYEEFKKEFIQILKDNMMKSRSMDVIDASAEAAWMAFGKLNQKFRRDEWGRIINKNPL